MREHRAEAIERLLAGELSRDEERQLAQAALDDPELFDALTAASVAKAALAHPSATAVRPAWRSRAILAALAAAAALVIAVAYGSRDRGANPPAPTAPPATAPTPAVIAAPILLAARLEAGAAPTFRTGAASGRLPKETGTIVQVGDATADLDLGSLDGLKPRDAVWIVRGQRRLGRMTITTVFRERARAQVEAGMAVEAGDRVEIDPAAHVNALVELAAARRAAGDLAAARELATTASERARGAGIAPDVRQQAVVELVTVLNELGARQIEQRDLAAAGLTLRSAEPLATGGLRARVANNLGALAALRGDFAEAERLYRDAEASAGSTPEFAADRQVIAKNLAALHASR